MRLSDFAKKCGQVKSNVKAVVDPKGHTYYLFKSDLIIEERIRSRFYQKPQNIYVDVHFENLETGAIEFNSTCCISDCSIEHLEQEARRVNRGRSPEYLMKHEGELLRFYYVFPLRNRIFSSQGVGYEIDYSKLSAFQIEQIKQYLQQFSYVKTAKKWWAVCF